MSHLSLDGVLRHFHFPLFFHVVWCQKVTELVAFWNPKESHLPRAAPRDAGNYRTLGSPRDETAMTSIGVLIKVLIKKTTRTRTTATTLGIEWWIFLYLCVVFISFVDNISDRRATGENFLNYDHPNFLTKTTGPPGDPTKDTSPVPGAQKRSGRVDVHRYHHRTRHHATLEGGHRILRGGAQHDETNDRFKITNEIFNWDEQIQGWWNIKGCFFHKLVGLNESFIGFFFT